jgi:hypothetical protein
MCLLFHVQYILYLSVMPDTVLLPPSCERWHMIYCMRTKGPSGRTHNWMTLPMINMLPLQYLSCFGRPILAHIVEPTCSLF